MGAIAAIVGNKVGFAPLFTVIGGVFGLAFLALFTLIILKTLLNIFDNIG